MKRSNKQPPEGIDAKDVLCWASLPSPFLRRTHAVHRRRKQQHHVSKQKPHAKKQTHAKKGAKTKPKTNENLVVHIHIMEPKEKSTTSAVLSYERSKDQGLPCPFCRSKTMTEQGLWVHLCTTVANHLRPTAVRSENGGTLHIGLVRRTPPRAVELQCAPSCVAGETEVTFWKRGNWRGKRYWSNGMSMAPLSAGPMVISLDNPKDKKDKAGTESSNNSDEENLATVSGPFTSDENNSSSNNNAESRKRQEAVWFYQYNDIVPLDEAIRQQLINNPPPVRNYWRATSAQSLTMGEWMLGAPSRPANSQWRQYLSNMVLNDFSDLLDAEKAFMKQWNAAVETHAPVTDKDTALICRYLLQQNDFDASEKVWKAHLLNLWEERHLGRNDMLVLMREYHEYQASRNVMMA